jgi:hypothetical protein
VIDYYYKLRRPYREIADLGMRPPYPRRLASRDMVGLQALGENWEIIL